MQSSTSRERTPPEKPRAQVHNFETNEPNLERDREFLYKALKKLKLLEYIIKSDRAELRTATCDIWRRYARIPFLWAEAERDYKRLQNQIEYHERSACQLKDDINKRIEIYAAPQCRELCNLMYDRLPIELRNMVYGYILGESTTVINESVLASSPNLPPDAEPGIKDILPDRFHRQICAGHAHVFKASFIGSQMKSELIACWYRATTFQFNDCQLIPDFLEHDRWGCNIDLRHCVRKVEVIRNLPKNYNMTDHPKSFDLDLIKNLEFLRNLRKGTEVTFWIRSLGVTSWDMLVDGITLQNVQRGVHRLRILFPTINLLLKMGYKVFVKMMDDEHFQVDKKELTADVWIEKGKSLIGRGRV